MRLRDQPTDEFETRPRAALANIAGRYWNAVFAVALAMLADGHEAEDVAQETFVAAYRNLRKLRSISSVGPWLCRIAQNQARLRLRKRHAGRKAWERYARAAVMERSAERPEEDAVDRKGLYAALGKLSYNQRVVTMLHYLDGYPHAEIAAMLGLSESSVRKRCHDARRKLRDELASLKAARGPECATKQAKSKTIAGVHAMGSNETSGQTREAGINPAERIIWISGYIDESLATDVVSKMLMLDSDPALKERWRELAQKGRVPPAEGEDWPGQEAPIFFYVSSGGGDLLPGLAIYDTMQLVASPVETYCVGRAAGVGALLVAAGAQGRRKCLPNSGLMLLAPPRQAEAELIELAEEKALVKFRRRFFELLAKHSGQDQAKLERDARKGLFMTAEEAREYGLIDEVVRPSR